jgi:hypothetical protein
VAVIAGRLVRFVQSGFAERPTADWDAQWALLVSGLLSGAEVEG